MSKKIVIVTDFQGELSDKIEGTLRGIYRDTVTLEHCYLNSMEEGYEIQGNVVLFMLEDRIERARKNIKNMDEVIVITRTILEKKALEIMKIPRGNKVLVVNDYYETSLQLTSLLYKLKIRDHRFITYKEGDEYPDIEYAVTAGIAERVPRHIKKIIDVGVRCLDTATLIHIQNKLKIKDKDVELRLLKYINNVVTLEDGMKKQYREFYQKNQRLNSVMEKSNDGIMMVNSKNEILLINDKGRELLNIKGRLDREYLQSELMVINEIIHRNSDVDGELIQINNKFIMISVKTSADYLGEWEKIVVLVDVTYIKKLEQTVSAKLKAKGLRARYSFDKIIYADGAMQECIDMAKVFSTTDKTVLIHGESGTGKELLAQSIHNESKRNKQPFVAVNCAALPESLLESELFGYDKGAFTGARKEGKSGLFEQANNGTIFLDEIGDMPYGLQSRLLRVLQERQVMRIGSDRIIDVDVRIIAATNKNLMKEVDKDNFREDLYYRLNVLPLQVPPLRERKKDIIPLFKEYSNENHIQENIREALMNYSWRGNVRELRNIAEYYSLMKDTDNPLPKEVKGETSVVKDAGRRIQLLKIIRDATDSSGGIGRSSLLDRYNKRYSHNKLSEYRLRAEIEDMQNLGLIEKTIGRKGCIITDEGRECILKIQ